MAKEPSAKLTGILTFFLIDPKGKIMDSMVKGRWKGSWGSLNKLDDLKLCFDVVFDVINRSAVRDYTICEGINIMVDGFYK